MSDAPERPDALDVDERAIPRPMREADAWLCWRYVERDDYWTKKPVNAATGGDGDATDPATWTDFDSALDYHREPATDTDGIGIAFDGTDLTGVDLDGCRDPDTGELTERARDIVSTVEPVAYVETSASGTGVHAYVRGEMPAGKNRSGDVEMYDSERYFAVTGAAIDGTGLAESVEAGEAALRHVHEAYVADDDDRAEDAPVRPHGDPSADTDLTDEEVVETGRAAANGDTFTDLFDRGDISGYDSHSEADLALVNLLAFYSGGDRRQIDRLFRESALCREKWTDREDYRDRTMTTALAGRTDYYDPDAGRTSPRARADGGSTADADEDDRALGPAIGWENVRALFDSNDKGSTTTAYDAAAATLLAEHDVVTVRETGGTYWYDPERGIYVRKGETYIRERLAEAIPGYINDSRERNIRNRVRDQTYLDADDFTSPEGKECVENGVLDLDTRELEPHSPEYHFTARLQTPYVEGAEPDRWPEFLEESVADPAEAKKLEEFIGYSLESWHHDREKNLFVAGPRQSGKSTYAETVQALFGTAPTVTNLTPQQIADTRFDAAALADAMLNCRNDINATKIEDSGTLKTVFSGEMLKLERKYEDEQFGAPTAKHLFTANWLPRIVGEDESLYRRVLIVEFPHGLSDDERDPDLKPTLAGELPGILNRALDARDRLHEQGGFTNDRDPVATRRKWDSWRDAHKRFLYTQFDVTGDNEDTVEKATYYRAYKEYAAREGYGLKPQQGVTKALKWVPEVAVGDDEYRGLDWRDADAAAPSTDRDAEQTSLDRPQRDRVRDLTGWVEQYAGDRGGTVPAEVVVARAEGEGYDAGTVADTLDRLVRDGRLVERDGGLAPE